MSPEKKNIYFAVTADVVDSQNPQYAELLNKIPDFLEILNHTYQPLVHFQIYAGDEIQGLLAINAPISQLIMEIISIFYPLNLRIEVGIGTLSTPILNDSGQMRGAAFINARKALQKVAQNQVRFESDEDNSIVEMFNHLWLMIGTIISRWDNQTFKRAKLFHDLANVKAIASVEKVSRVAINKYLNNNSIKQIAKTISFMDKNLSLLSQPSVVYNQ